MSIKGALGIMVWTDTLNDPLCVKPTDLAVLDSQKVSNDKPKAIKDATKQAA